MPKAQGDLPSIFWGEASESIYLYLHGEGGSKEEARLFAEQACPRGWQVLSVDLPEHGARRDGKELTPWDVLPELGALTEHLRRRWKRVGLCGVSAGAWFALQGLAKERLTSCLLVSPVLDMQTLIAGVMRGAGVSPMQLLQEQRVKLPSGGVLDWEYYMYAREHPVLEWQSPTAILYGGKDRLVRRAEVEAFARQFSCPVTVAEEAGHWFRTEDELRVLERFFRRNIPLV